MARFCGNIGFGQSVETSPGVWEYQISERRYYGDITKFYYNNQSSNESTIDNLTVNNSFSVMGDPFMYQNFNSMVYVEWMGTKWKVNSVEVEYPRLKINVGGVYNGRD